MLGFNTRLHQLLNGLSSGRGGRGRTTTRLLPVAVLAGAALLMIGVGVASASNYTGLLQSGTIGVSGAASSSGGYIYGQDSWTAPSGTNFDGFAYTGAAFSVVSDNSVGGISVGFGGDGGANQPNILFPWTDDCSITNTGHYWTDSSVVAGTSGRQSCSTSGNTSGWNYANAEIDNAAPGTNPQSEYHTLWFTAFCQAGTCNYDRTDEWGAGSGSVTNLSANVDDPNPAPTVTGASWTGNNGGDNWYQTDSNSPSINASAADPAGVCAIGAWLTGPDSYYVQLTNSSPGMESPGGPIGTEFDSITPCPGTGGGAVGGSATFGANLASGTYNLALVASNPGNWEANTGLSNAPTIANYQNTINIDDTVPSINWSNASGAWSSSTGERFTVSAGPSGLSHVSCTDNGVAVGATLVGSNTYSVPTTTQGANNMSCTASNGDANGSLSGSAAQTYNVDSIVPTVHFTDNGYSPGTWTNTGQTVGVTATTGPSGLQGLTCTLDGNDGTNLNAGESTISTNGVHLLSCSASSYAGITGTGTYAVSIDNRQPAASFLVNGAAPIASWLTGTPVVQVVGSENGGVLSGLAKIVCSITTNGVPNPGSPVTLSIAGGNLIDNTGSFLVDANGSDVVSCVGTTEAGTTQTTPDVMTVNVDNPNDTITGAGVTQYGSSNLIDNGADPYSNGPSQTTWYTTPQSITITANDTGGSAPISSISCKGALSGTWPISNLNTDSARGEQITITVPSGGGELSCTAADTAGNTYTLGGYNFQIDATAPTGYFEPQSAWKQPDDVQLHVSDGAHGSGTTSVEVTAQDGSGQVYKVNAIRDPSDAEEWDAMFNDGTMPPGTYTFNAYPRDLAGNSGEITTDQAGASESLRFPLRDETGLSANLTAGSKTTPAIRNLTVPAALNIAAGATDVKMNAAVRGRSAHALERTAPPAVSSADRDRTKLKSLTLRYGRRTTVAGYLWKGVEAVPVYHARIQIYAKPANGTLRRVGSTVTNRTGHYRYTIKSGPSRTIYVLYDGTRRLRSASDTGRVRVHGSVVLAAKTKLVAGDHVTFTGQIKGGHIPRGGAVVTLDYEVKGVMTAFSSFAAPVRSNSSGEFRLTVPVPKGGSGYTYRFRALVVSQSGWSYLTATSPSLSRRIS